MSSTITLVGNLTGEPHILTTGNGTVLARFSLAVNRVLKAVGDDGQRDSAVSYFNCVAFGEQAANAAESLLKGSRVVVTGRIDQRSWTDQNEQKRSGYEVVVDEVAVSLRFATVTVVPIHRVRPGDESSSERVLVGAGASNGSAGATEPF